MQSNALARFMSDKDSLFSHARNLEVTLSAVQADVLEKTAQVRDASARALGTAEFEADLQMRLASILAELAQSREMAAQISEERDMHSATCAVLKAENEVRDLEWDVWSLVR
jgi:hypothetical protein